MAELSFGCCCLESIRRRFLKDSKVVSNLKLRLSYGEIGNQAIDSYQTMTRLKSKTYSWAGNGFYTWQPDGLANKGLGWEVSKTWNAGVDLGYLIICWEVRWNFIIRVMKICC